MQKLYLSPPHWSLTGLFIASSMLLSWISWIPFPYKMPLLVWIILLYIYSVYGSLKGIGFKKMPLLSTLFWGFGLSVAVLLISNFFKPILEYFFSEKADYSSYGQLKGNLELVIELWAKAMISAAVCEEIFYRGYLFFILEKLVKGTFLGKILIVIFTAVFFGFVHNNQGIVGMINITIIGILFGSVYYMSDKNLWATILAHAIVDTFGLYALYEGTM